ncbi:MAG TPA: LPS export ABC transporter ATP-binding protein [Bacillota bacterium]|nr:LPS export ABC transporter ATP-binding protein [Bacillota bacterium]HPQ10971.1 LPS export ABC transporter ATP-binding protein [Bacillota bacterium]
MTIRAENLVKIYGQRKVVDEVTIEVNRGEVVGLLGPNGAGKTTTFYMIVGIESVNGGRILLDGHDVTHLSMHKRALKGIGYLPQEPSVFRKLTVEENIMAILEARGADAKTQRHRTEELIEEFKLGVVRKTKGIRLSGGERRRTEIARALATDPSFILLDEPFAGVDPIAVADIQEIIAMLREKNLGVLITDHNVRETLTITDRAYIMHEGHILVEGSSKEIANDLDARRLYLGERFSL